MIKECDIELPIYSKNKEVREKRKQEYLKVGKQLYPFAPKFSINEYENIKSSLKNGDFGVISRLLELSINPLNEALAAIFAKYDLDEILSYEEAFSYCLELLDKHYAKFTELPDLYVTFTNSLINYYAYKFVHRRYSQIFINQNTEITMPKESVIWEQDKNDNFEIDETMLAQETNRNLIMMACESLSERQKEVVMLRFGLTTGVPMSCVEIGQQLNISRGRVTSLVNRAIDKLRANKNFRKLTQI